MSHTPHELHEEFPEFAARITALKSGDPEFARMAEDYHQVNRLVHRMETDVEPTDDVTLEDAKKRRLALKDQIFTRLDPAEA